MMFDSVTFISRKHAERIYDRHRKAERVIISVTTPAVTIETRDVWEELEAAAMVPTHPAKLDEHSWADVLRLEFHDAEPSATKKFRIYFSEKQAMEVIEFLSKHAGTGVKEVFVHCDAGISRSAAIAKFAAQQYGMYFDPKYSVYNKFVFSTLLKVSGQIPRGPEDSAFNQP